MAAPVLVAPVNPIANTTSTAPLGNGGALANAFNNSAPDYYVGLSLNIPIRNRIAKSDQYRSELESAPGRTPLSATAQADPHRSPQRAVLARPEPCPRHLGHQGPRPRTEDLRDHRQGAAARRGLCPPDPHRSPRPRHRRIFPCRRPHRLPEGPDRAGPRRRPYPPGQLHRHRSRAGRFGCNPSQPLTRICWGSRSMPNSPNPNPCRLLIADDQPSILEALEILLEPEGYRLETCRSPALALDALASTEFDGILIDLNYSRDTTSGNEGPGPAGRHPPPPAPCPRHRDDSLGQRRSRRRGHAPRGQRLHPEALGQSPPAHGPPHPARTPPAPSAAPSGSKPRTASCAPKELPTSSPPPPPCVLSSSS